MVVKAGSEDLRLVFQPAKGPRVDNSVPVALEIVPVRMRKLRIPPALGSLDGKSKTGQHATGRVSRREQ
jgi:hypothetical protein